MVISMIKRRGKRKKRINYIAPVIIILVLIAAGWGVYFYLDRNKVSFKEDVVKVNLGEELYNTDNLDKDYDIKKEKIDTSKIGEQEVSIKIKDKEYTYKVIVEDREGPTIAYKDTITITAGSKVDLLSGVTATDNSGEDIKVNVEGDYVTSKEGTYELKYVAKDSSGNVTKKDFKLVVNKKPVVNTPSQNEFRNEDGEFTTSKGFKGVTKNGITYIDGLLIANKTYALPSSYGPGLNAKVNEAANKMFSDAKAKGFSLWIASGFRSYNTQRNLYNGYAGRDGKAAADRYSARPGHSEHQTGLAFDVCDYGLNNACINSNFDNTAQAKWLSENAYKYGFILRYPKGKESETGYIYESWHFRYVGVELATKLYNNGNWITLEEYLGITSEYSY